MDFDQILELISSREVIGIVVLIIVGLIIVKLSGRLNKVLLFLIAVVALLIVAYFFFPALLESAVDWVRGGWKK